MAEEKKTTISGMEVDQYAEFAEATLLGPTKIKNLENRLKKEEKKLEKLVRESKNVFYGEEVDNTAILAQEKVIQELKDQITKVNQDLQTTINSAKKTERINEAEQRLQIVQDELSALLKSAKAKEEIIVPFGTGGPVVKRKVTADIIEEARDKVSNAKLNLRAAQQGKTVEEIKQEVADQQAQRGSAGSETADIGTITGAPRKLNIPLGDGEVNLGTTASDIPLALQERFGTVPTKENIRTTDYAEGLFYSNSSAGRQIRNQLRSILESFGVTDVSEAKLESYWKEAVTATSAANQADNPNQSVWDTLRSSLSAASDAGELGDGAGTGPSAEAIKAKKESVRLLATQLGVTLTDNQINDLAYRFANGELDSTTINFRIAKIGEIDFAAGEAANTINDLKTKAAEYGILYSPDWYTKSTRKVLTGEIDQDTIDQQIRDLAKSQFPTLSAQIDEGYTVKQIASPYIQSMAAILEIDPTTIGLQDLSIKQALTGVDMDGKPTTKPLWLFEQDLRKDPRWNYTKNAQEATMGVARRVLQDFGLAY